MSAVSLTDIMPTKHQLLGAVVSGVVAGLVLSVWMLIGEVVGREPSQLTEMERHIAGWFGGTTPTNAPMVAPLL